MTTMTYLWERYFNEMSHFDALKPYMPQELISELSAPIDTKYKESDNNEYLKDIEMRIEVARALALSQHTFRIVSTNTPPARITNLDELRNSADYKTIDTIIMQYIAEAIADKNTLHKFKDCIEVMDNNIKIDIKTIKGLLESCNEYT